MNKQIVSEIKHLHLKLSGILSMIDNITELQEHGNTKGVFNHTDLNFLEAEKYKLVKDYNEILSYINEKQKDLF